MEWLWDKTWYRLTNAAEEKSLHVCSYVWLCNRCLRVFGQTLHFKRICYDCSSEFGMVTCISEEFKRTFTVNVRGMVSSSLMVSTELIWDFLFVSWHMSIINLWLRFEDLKVPYHWRHTVCQISQSESGDGSLRQGCPAIVLEFQERCVGGKPGVLWRLVWICTLCSQRCVCEWKTQKYLSNSHPFTRISQHLHDPRCTQSACVILNIRAPCQVKLNGRHQRAWDSIWYVIIIIMLEAF